MTHLTDGHGRTFQYLRLSLHDACNFRCLYCLPNGYKPSEAEPPLSVAEIKRLVAAFASLGFWKVRLTGGEPALRPDLLEVCRTVSAIPGVRKLALSTNGTRLPILAPELASAGVSAVNVSVDSLDPERFRQITGRDNLDEAMEGVRRCLDLGLETKVNAVLLKGLNEADWEGLVGLARGTPLSVRFIELMPARTNGEVFASRHMRIQELERWLVSRGWTPQPRREGDGPARKFRHPDFRGSVGLIAPYSPDFCSTCNRLRVTSRGGLRLCLFAESEASLRPWLQKDDQAPELQEQVRLLIGRKEISHYLPDGVVGNLRHFAMTGG